MVLTSLLSLLLVGIVAGTPLLFGGDTGSTAGGVGPGTLICSTYYDTVYSTVYDTILVKKVSSKFFTNIVFI